MHDQFTHLPKASPCALPCILLHFRDLPNVNSQSRLQAERLPVLLQEVPLTADDLLIVCKLGNLLVSRPMSQCISHAEALQQAHSLAMQWLHPTASHIASLDNNTSEYLPLCLSLMSTFAVQLLDSAGVKWHTQAYHLYQTPLLSMSADVTTDMADWELQSLLDC